MTETDFVTLNEHLVEVRPIFEAFCAKHGFTLVDKRSLGRYPRLRIEKTDTVRRWFDLWMEFDEKGRYRTAFTPDVPYELSGGASTEKDDGSQDSINFFQTFVCFSDKPFREVPRILMDELEKYLPQLEQWDTDYLRAHGKRVQPSSG